MSSRSWCHRLLQGRARTCGEDDVGVARGAAQLGADALEADGVGSARHEPRDLDHDAQVVPAVVVQICRATARTRENFNTHSWCICAEKCVGVHHTPCLRRFQEETKETWTKLHGENLWTEKFNFGSMGYSTSGEFVCWGRLNWVGGSGTEVHNHAATKTKRTLNNSCETYWLARLRNQQF